MDLSKSSDAVGQTRSADIECVQEAVQRADMCMDSLVAHDAAGSETVSQLEMPCDFSKKTSDASLNSTDETRGELVSCDVVSDSQPGQVETEGVVHHSEMLLQPAEINSGQEDEESSQFSTTDDNHDLVPSFGVQSEELGDGGSGLMQPTVKVESLDDGSGLVQTAFEAESLGDDGSSLVKPTVEVESLGDDGSGLVQTAFEVGSLGDDGTSSVQHVESLDDGNGLVQEAVEVESLPDDGSELVQPTVELESLGDDGTSSVQQAMEVESSGVRDSGEESQQLSCELGSRSQSPMSFVVLLNEDSECSLKSLPPGEHGPTNFGMKLSRLVDSGKSYITNVTADYLEDESRYSQVSERMTDEPDLLMEVETGSTVSEAVSVKDSTTSLYPSSTKATSTSSRKSTGHADDRSKSRIRKRLMVEPAATETEDGFVTLLR